MAEQDQDWKATKRESQQDVIRRVHSFLQWLATREEENVVVVSHGVWIECCLQVFCPGALSGGERVQNCDMYVGQVVSRNGAFQRLQYVTRAFQKPGR